MRLRTIVDAAHLAAVEVKVEGDMIAAAVDGGNEASSIHNARKGFQAVLSKTVGLLGNLPANREELQTAECPDEMVVAFIHGVHQAVMEELASCDFLEPASDKYVYGRYISKATDLFLKDLGDKVKLLGNKVPRVRVEEIGFEPSLMDILADRKRLAIQNAAQTPGWTKVKDPEAVAREYEALMAKLRSEKKIG